MARGEDERQVARWNGVCGDKGRWKQNLIAKCLRDGKARADTWICRIYRHSSHAKIDIDIPRRW